MRAACRKFLDHMSDHGRHEHRFHDEQEFWLAMGELRAAFGIQLARLCVAFGIEVTEELAEILPTDDTETEQP
jgi:hypothetical protein